jgi:hypothetical protein
MLSYIQRVHFWGYSNIISRLRHFLFFFLNSTYVEHSTRQCQKLLCQLFLGCSMSKTLFPALYPVSTVAKSIFHFKIWFWIHTSITATPCTINKIMKYPSKSCVLGRIPKEISKYFPGNFLCIIWSGYVGYFDETLITDSLIVCTHCRCAKAVL